MWVWLELKLTPKGDFGVVSVRAFFMHSTKRYLNGQTKCLSIPNTVIETKICNFHAKARQRAYPSLLLGSRPPGLQYLMMRADLMGGAPVKRPLHFRSSFTKHKQTVCSHYGGRRLAGINYKNRKLVPANTEWMVRWSERDRLSLDFNGQVAVKIMKKRRRRKKPNYSSPQWRQVLGEGKLFVYVCNVGTAIFDFIADEDWGKQKLQPLREVRKALGGKNWARKGKREMENFSLLWSTGNLT